MKIAKKVLSAVLVIVMVISSNNLCFAAGKTIGAYKCNYYNQGYLSDCEEMIYGMLEMQFTNGTAVDINCATGVASVR